MAGVSAAARSSIARTPGRGLSEQLLVEEVVRPLAEFDDCHALDDVSLTGPLIDDVLRSPCRAEHLLDIGTVRRPRYLSESPVVQRVLDDLGERTLEDADIAQP
jgi:hypothetical protein